MPWSILGLLTTASRGWSGSGSAVGSLWALAEALPVDGGKRAFPLRRGHAVYPNDVGTRQPGNDADPTVHQHIIYRSVDSVDGVEPSLFDGSSDPFIGPVVLKIV